MTRRPIDPNDFVADEDQDDIPVNRSSEPTVGDVIAARVSRREALRGMAAAGLAGPIALAAGRADAKGPTEKRATLDFAEFEASLDETVHVPDGYRVEVLIGWGDAVLPGAADFDVANQRPADQEKQFGYNCDFIAFMPLPLGSDGSDHGLLCVNHEYTIPEMMYPEVAGKEALKKMSRSVTEVDVAAHGHAVVEVKRSRGKWTVLRDGPYNRRISALSTPIRISGPAAGDDRMKTTDDPSGTRVIGTLNNCAGGVTPWGTVLICEENFNFYFDGDGSKTSEAESLARFGIGRGADFRRKSWGRHFPRFNVEKEPHEPNRFGWSVEFDPYDPKSTPVKRTALGRLKHEGCGVVLNRDGRVVIYCGDDQHFEYLYKFVSDGRFDAGDRAANRDLLDSGTLFVARLDEDGSLHWLPLVWGSGPLVPGNGFRSQADVLIETRLAGDLLGATPMDRPEDVEVSPITGRAYAMLTKNEKRTRVNAANPRRANRYGHVIEMIPPGEGSQADHAALTYQWEVFLLAGDPAEPLHGAEYGEGVSRHGWLSCPDNGAFDPSGRLWIATDGAPKAVSRPDGLYACQTTGPNRAVTRRFFTAPVGAEVCGPCFTPDGTTLFISVQHPGEGSSISNPSTRWPDFSPGIPPRPAVVAVTRDGGGPIGG